MGPQPLETGDGLVQKLMISGPSDGECDMIVGGKEDVVAPSLVEKPLVEGNNNVLSGVDLPGEF